MFKVSNSIFTEWEIRDMCYLLVGTVENIKFLVAKSRWQGNSDRKSYLRLVVDKPAVFVKNHCYENFENMLYDQNYRTKHLKVHSECSDFLLSIIFANL